MSSRALIRPLRAAFLAATLAIALVAAPASGAVVFQAAQQGSAASTDVLDTTVFSVSPGANQLMIIAVSGAGAIPVSKVSFRGVAAQRFFSQDNGEPGSICRTELWRILEPPAGSGFVSVTMASATSFGVGVMLYSGVDQKTPTTTHAVIEANTSAIAFTVNLPDTRPLVAVGCLGGSWPMRAGPDAVAGAGDFTLWDFTERNVVGLGGQQISTGSTTVSWNVSFSASFAWAAIWLSIVPAAVTPPPPDAGPDVAPDVAPVPPDARPPTDPMTSAPDAGLDQAPPPPPPPPDAGADAQVTEEDAGEIRPEPDADVENADADPEPPLPGDAALPVPGDPGGGAVHDVNLEIGCACRVGSGGRAGLVPALAFLLVLARRRRR